MKLFSNETFNVKRISTVAKYNSETEQGGRRVKIYSSSPVLYEIIFNISGKSTVYFNGKTLENTSGSIRYLPKGEFDGEYKVEVEEEGVCIDIFFDTDDSMPSSAVCVYDVWELKNSFEKIYNIWLSRETGYYAKAMSLMYEIIAYLKKKSESYLPSAKNERIEAARKYMTENFGNKKFDFSALCESTGLSYSYFKESFINRYGVPPVKYLTNMRLEYAKELLVTKRYSISEIADMCGYENVYYFSSVFKKHIGVSPKKYKV